MAVLNVAQKKEHTEKLNWKLEMVENEKIASFLLKVLLIGK